MSDNKRAELTATGLGLVALGGGAGFSLLPRLFARAFGVRRSSAAESGTQLVVRALGFRDLAFGLGLLANRSQPQSARQWLRFFTICMAGDVIACFLAFLKPGRTATMLIGGLASGVFGTLAWLAGQDKEN